VPSPAHCAELALAMAEYRKGPRRDLHAERLMQREPGCGVAGENVGCPGVATILAKDEKLLATWLTAMTQATSNTVFAFLFTCSVGDEQPMKVGVDCPPRYVH